MSATSVARRRLAVVASLFLLGGILIYAIIKAGATEVRLDEFSLSAAPGAAGAPAMNQGAAARIALKSLTELNGSVRGLVLVEVHFAHNLSEIRNAAGSLSFSSTDAADCWVFVYVAPPQNGFKNVKALVVVDAGTGIVSSAQILQSN